MKLRRSILAATVLFASFEAAKAGAATLPGFQQTIVYTGLDHPTAVRFSPDGRVFVAEKSGLIKVFPSLSAVTPTIFADLRDRVNNYWDRGLLGLELHKNFPATPYIYVLYTYDHDPTNPNPNQRWNDKCPNPPGGNNGCPASGRLSRLTASGNVMTGDELVLLEAWGQQFPSHSMGDLHFGNDGALYVSAGEGASFENVDYGQFGNPLNPLGDPPVPIGGAQTAPTAEGGALRSLSLLRSGGGPVLTNGAILRVNDVGNALSTNPLFGSSDPIARRIIASGLRNPYRFAMQPGSDAIWIADVGWRSWEEIDTISDPTGGVVNFGWPCYEGAGQQGNYAAEKLNICETLYNSPGTVTPPAYAYNHSDKVVPGESCPSGTSSISGITFYNRKGVGNYPANYDGALFFADYSRRCAWVMFPSGGEPDPTNIATFISFAATPVDLQIGPEGDLYYVDHGGGTIRRVQYNVPKTVATATPKSGAAPLSVHFDGSGSQPAQPGDTLTYAWDLDGDGQFDDSTAQTLDFVYSSPGSFTARLRVTDNHGMSKISDPIVISASNAAPTAVIDTPGSSLTWKVGDVITFSGHATDPQDGTLPASALTWNVVLLHCPADCHEHTLETLIGASGGSFAAPDHDYPSSLRLDLTATDSEGLSTTQSVSLQPKTVNLAFQSTPSGMQILIGDGGGATPFTRTVIVGSQNTINAPSPQTLGGSPYAWVSWSDGGAESHTVTAGSTPMTLRATYAAADLSTSAASDPAPVVCSGSALAYTLSVHNAGPTAATNVSLSATVPAGATLVSASGSGWTCSGSATVVCTRPNLAVGDAPPVTMTVDAPTGSGTIQTAVSVTASTSDLKGSNNSASVTTTVAPGVTTAGNNGPVCAGETLVLSASSQPGALYHWTGPNGWSSSVRNPSIPAVTAAQAGTYSVTATLSGCTSAPATTVVNVETAPSAAITAPSAVCVLSSDNVASVPDAGDGASYNWSISNGTITAGAGTRTIHFSPGGNPSNPVAMSVMVSKAIGCSATSSLSIPITSCLGSFFTATPCRVVDTRRSNGPYGGPALPASGDRLFTFSGRCGIPTTARAVALNLTVTKPTAAGSLNVRPTGSPLSSATMISYGAGQTRAASSVVALSSGGGLIVHSEQASGTVQLIIDVSGYFQ